MIKKSLFFIISFMVLIILSGCPDKDKTKSEESEQIPNTMEKAATELEKIITLLGGPMFDNRDKIEQLKNEQMQMLSTKIGENPQQSTIGSGSSLYRESGGTEKGEGKEENQEQQGEQGQGATGEKQRGATGEQEQGTGGEQKKEAGGDQKKEAGGEQQKETGGDQKKEAGGEQQKETGGDQKKEAGGEQQKETGGDQKKEAGGEGGQGSEEEQKSSEEGQKGSPKGGQEAQPSGGGKEEKPFQFEDSLFGIPQWNEENWKMIKVLTDGMYFTWNNLQPALLEKGVTEAQGESFGASLENLSKAVKDRNIGGAQTAAFELYDQLSEFFSYFKTEKPPELQRVSSMVTGIHFSVRQNDWNKAQELSNELQKEFTKVKTSVRDNQSAVIKMLELSLDDLRSAVQKQDAILVLIRTNLVTANIEELDASLSQEQKE